LIQGDDKSSNRPDRRVRPFAVVALTIALGLGALTPFGAQAADPGPQVGEKVKDAQGKVAGPIERVVFDADNRPRQVEVRVGGMLRVLPIAALSRAGDTYVSVLSRAEIDALPGVK
jgi:hypothetical protein